MYAATHSDRVTALILANVAVSGGIVRDTERRALMLEMVESNWGEGRFAALFAPSRMRAGRRRIDARPVYAWGSALARVDRSPGID